MDALDLTAHAPRSPYEPLGGLLMLARTIDKLRAELPGGNLGEYHFSGFSERLAASLQITHDDLLKVVADAHTDADVAAWVRAHSDPASYDALNDEMRSRKIDESNRERLSIKYPVLLEQPQIDGLPLFDLMMLDDAEIFGKSTV